MAEVLLNLAERIDEASEVVERLLATPEENVKRFKRRLAGLKRGRKFVDWRDFPPHESYKEELSEEHGRKHSFWARYKA